MLGKVKMAAKKWDASGEIDVHFPLLAYLLNIKELYPEQKAALKEFFSGKNLYFWSLEQRLSLHGPFLLPFLWAMQMATTKAYQETAHARHAR